jgi:hypothetical protein
VLTILDLDGVVLDLTAERPVKLLGARLVTEYRGAGLSYALRAAQPVAEVTALLQRTGLPLIPVLGFDEPIHSWMRSIACSKPGVHVSARGMTALPSWVSVTFDRTWPYPVLVQHIWNSAPSEEQEEAP